MRGIVLAGLLATVLGFATVLVEVLDYDSLSVGHGVSLALGITWAATVVTFAVLAWKRWHAPNV